MESILAASITGLMTLVGVLFSNSKSRAVMEYKIDELRRHVEKHNQVIDRVYALEKSVGIIERDVEEIKERTDSL